MKKICSLEKIPVIFTLSVFILGFICACGKSPSDIPPPITGAIKITASVDTTLVDSIKVELDGTPRGYFKNPCILSPVVAGTHLIAVSKDDPESPIDFSGGPRRVHVAAGETIQVAFALTKLAPDFTLNNLNNQPIRLENYRGKVVLLVFYTHT